VDRLAAAFAGNFEAPRDPPYVHNWPVPPRTRTRVGRLPRSTVPAERGPGIYLETDETLVGSGVALALRAAGRPAPALAQSLPSSPEYDINQSIT